MHLRTNTARGGMALLVCLALVGLLVVGISASCSKGSRSPSLPAESYSQATEGLPASCVTVGGFRLRAVTGSLQETEPGLADFSLGVQETERGTCVTIIAARPTSQPDVLLELLYDPGIYSPEAVHPGEEIDLQENLFLAVTSQPGCIPLAVSRMAPSRLPPPTMPGGTVIAVADFARSPSAAGNANTKSVSALVAGMLHALVATVNDQQALIAWRGGHPGDYDLNGTVTIADITPLAIHYGSEPRIGSNGLPLAISDNEYVAHIDTSGNGVVDIADVTAIAVNYGSSVVGYRLYLGAPDEEEEPVWDSAFIPNAGDPDAPYTIPFNTSREAGEFQAYSLQLDLSAIGD